MFKVGDRVQKHPTIWSPKRFPLAVLQGTVTAVKGGRVFVLTDSNKNPAPCPFTGLPTEGAPVGFLQSELIRIGP